MRCLVLIERRKNQVNFQTSVYSVDEMDRDLSLDDQHIFTWYNIHHTKTRADDTTVGKDIDTYDHTIDWCLNEHIRQFKILCDQMTVQRFCLTLNIRQLLPHFPLMLFHPLDTTQLEFCNLSTNTPDIAAILGNIPDQLSMHTLQFKNTIM